MKRGSVFALLACLTVAGGCASPAHYVEQKTDSGVVAIPDTSDTWPNYNMRAAKALIEQHVGPNYEMGSPYQAKTGQTAATGLSVLPDPGTEWRIPYKRTAGTPANDLNNRGVTPAGGTTAGQGPAPGVMPSVLPVSAQRGMTGSTSNYRSAVGGSDCQQ